MKHLKQIAGVVLAMVMALTMTVTAFAATVDNQTEHSYDAYQIFSGTQADSSVPLGDAEWGTGVDGPALLTALKADSRFAVGDDDANIFASCSTALDVAAVLGNYSDKSDVAQAFANVAAAHLTSVCTPIAAGATSVDLATGYYLLVDTSNPGEGDARNSALLQVTNQGDITIEKKYDVPTVDKSVQDSDDTWGEAADWEIGSNVPFTLTGTLPTNYADYESYKYVFHDTLSAGLKYNGDATVYVVNGGIKVPLTSGFTITPADADATTGGGGTLTVTFDNLKDITSVSSASNIVVEYTAELLNTAVIGGTGNSNKVKLEYSNDPNTTGDGTTGNTPEDEVKVYTYELDVFKVDGKTTTKMLPNAEFVLLDNTKTKAAKVTNGKFVEWADVTTAADGTVTYPEGSTLVSGTDGKVAIAGLDAGSYYLRETKAPSGYNVLKNDIKLDIAAELDKTEATGPALSTLGLTVTEDKEGATSTQGDGSTTTGIVSTNVANNSGPQLPETGGIGTTIFYIAGGILVVTAGVLLVTKKRMEARK